MRLPITKLKDSKERYYLTHRTNMLRVRLNALLDYAETILKQVDSDKVDASYGKLVAIMAEMGRADMMMHNWVVLSNYTDELEKYLSLLQE